MFDCPRFDIGISDGFLCSQRKRCSDIGLSASACEMGQVVLVLTVLDFPFQMEMSGIGLSASACEMGQVVLVLTVLDFPFQMEMSGIGLSASACEMGQVV